MKEHFLSVDYCAFMVAILLARHEVNNKNSEKQWSSAEISEELNTLAYAASIAISSMKFIKVLMPLFEDDDEQGAN